MISNFTADNILLLHELFFPLHNFSIRKIFVFDFKEFIFTNR